VGFARWVLDTLSETSHLVTLWPGTGEVGTTHGKESGNAEITIVI
jgi:hypothetical protein